MSLQQDKNRTPNSIERRYEVLQPSQSSYYLVLRIFYQSSSAESDFWSDNMKTIYNQKLRTIYRGIFHIQFLEAKDDPVLMMLVITPSVAPALR